MKKILIVEDREEVQLVYTIIFQKHGLKGNVSVVQVESAELALKKLLEEKPDLMIVDISLPGIDGIEFTRIVKNKHPEIPVFIVTGHDRELYYDIAKRAGANDFITKGDGVNLIEKVKAILHIA
jgi:CheY-like chemotaxis protein